MLEVPSTHVVTCFECNAQVVAEQVARYARTEGDDEVGSGKIWRLLICPRCDQVFLLEQTYQHAGVDTYLDEPEQLYPTITTPLDRSSVPDSVRARAESARRVFRIGEYEATVMYVRKALEVLAKDLGAPKEKLQKQLNWLEQQGRLDARLYTWADQLRLIGNEGVHGVERIPSQLDAADALSFLEAIVDNVYVFVVKYEEFAARRRT